MYRKPVHLPFLSAKEIEIIQILCINFNFLAFIHQEGLGCTIFREADTGTPHYLKEFDTIAPGVLHVKTLGLLPQEMQILMHYSMSPNAHIPEDDICTRTLRTLLGYWDTMSIPYTLLGYKDNM